MVRRAKVHRTVGAAGIDLDSGQGFHVALTRDGLVLRGTLVDEECCADATLSLVCWDEVELFGPQGRESPGGLPARYDAPSGRCLDEEGRPATNPLPVEVVRETRFAACADLRGVALNGADYGYPVLDGWYLSGALLDDAELFFGDLRGAMLEGADLSGLGFGYALVEGTVDEHTILPAEGCLLEEGHRGPTVTCRR